MHWVLLATGEKLNAHLAFPKTRYHVSFPNEKGLDNNCSSGFEQVQYGGIRFFLQNAVGGVHEYFQQVHT